MVGVEVGDHDRLDVAVVAAGAELPEDAVAAVEQECTGARPIAGLDEVAAAGAPRVGPGRRLAEHRELHGYAASGCGSVSSVAPSAPIRSIGCAGGVNPCGESGRKVVQGSPSSRAQSIRTPK